MFRIRSEYVRTAVLEDRGRLPKTSCNYNLTSTITFLLNSYICIQYSLVVRYHGIPLKDKILAIRKGQFREGRPLGKGVALYYQAWWVPKRGAMISAKRDLSYATDGVQA